MLKFWWGAPEGDLLGLAWQVSPPPPFLTADSTGVDCIFTLVLPCETFAESSDDLLHLTYLTLLRYHRAHCLGRQGDRIRRISQASNVKKPTRFIVTCWIVGSDEEHNNEIWSVVFPAIERLPVPLSARICLEISQHLLQSYARWRISAFFGISIVGPGSLFIKKVNKSTYC